MKNRIITVTGVCAILMSNALSYAEDKKQLATTKITNIIDSSDAMSQLSFVIVDRYTTMGECQEGQKARKEIEAKRDLATQEIQEKSKKFEKSKNDYINKSRTMTDAAREKEEKQLLKEEREIKEFVAEKEEELKMEMHAATENLALSVDSAIIELAKNQNVDVVFDKMTGQAIYVSQEFDFTDKAIKEVNKQYEIKLAQNKQVENALKVADNKSAAAKPAKISA